MRILKFGGSSVGNPERAEKAINITAEKIRSGLQVAVVFSAYEGVTNELIALSTLASKGDPSYSIRLEALKERHFDYLRALIPPKDQSESLVKIALLLKELEELLQGVYLLREISPRTRDSIISFGERLSAFTLSRAFTSRGIDSEFLDARAVIVTNNAFGSAKVDEEITEQRIAIYFKSHPKMQVVTGFISSTVEGDTTTLGRGGSDYTAAIFGAALHADEVEIWTDVDGMMTADPRKVPKAFVQPEVSYEEALELCHFGAKVIYTPTLAPAMAKNIPIRILNTFNPKAPGTVIKQKVVGHEYPITGITSIDEITLIQVQGSGLIGIAGIASRLFAALARAKVNIILISQASSEHSICLAVIPAEAELARMCIHDEFALEIEKGLIDKTEVSRELSVVSIVGENMKKSPGISGRLFGALGKNGINVVAIAQGSSELNISTVVKRADEAKALVCAHEAFFLSEERTLNLFVIGTGLIGGTLLSQLSVHCDALKKDLALNIKLVGICKSDKAFIDANGLPFQAWDKMSATFESTSVTEQFIAEIKKLNLPNSIFVDCTADEKVSAKYIELLNASIPVITPNKKAQSGSFEYYVALKKLAVKRGVPFLFETSVGAGLPVISTLNDLTKSGDKVLKIEAILSGTLSFIFNTWCGEEGKSISFSEIVKKAKSLGYTEPDPRDDLNGLDAARKLLILAREAGIKAELSDVKIDRFIPSSLFDLKSSDDFLKQLRSNDASMNDKRSKAAAKGSKLCYMGVVENNSLSLTLTEIGPNHAFYSLSGADNIVSFTTDRYKERPLVVRGPGAGADVTAAGVFADIIRLSHLGRP